MPCPARLEHAVAARADGLEVAPQAPEEERLADDRFEAPAFGFEDAEDGAIDRLGLPTRVRRTGGGLTVEEELPGLGAVHSTQHDLAAVRLERLGPGPGAMRG